MSIQSSKLLLLATAVILFSFASSTVAGDCGDINNDGTGPDLSDLTYLVDYLFLGGATPQFYTANVNGDSDHVVDLSDMIYLVNYVFLGGPVPDCAYATGTVTDIDGNVYQTIRIGDQWWMAENLKVTHYRNGDPIEHVSEASAWRVLSTGAYCEWINPIVPDYVETYGIVYNAYAVHDSRNLAPEGWHVPSDAEWKQLEMYLGMSQSDADSTGWRGTGEGGKLKEAGLAHWHKPNAGGHNGSGFTALAGGFRNRRGIFENFGADAIYWTSTRHVGDTTWFHGLSNFRSSIRRLAYDPRYGYSMRCVRDE
ncbi:MAG: FISUMP domain-containing protein [candidate division Zixibacteria bacterium]|jgi:uncharacterized protein (TIGR02145 family)|nr:FISUMP domain-containing protein [candidate division Zixibacteria bacterium]